MCCRLKENRIFACLFPLVVIGAYLLLLSVIPQNSPKVYCCLALLLQTFVSVISCIYVKKVLGKSVGYTGKRLIIGLFLYGLPFWFYTFMNFLGSSGTPDISFMDGLPYLFLYFLLSIGVGFAEESLFRILLFGTLRHYFGESRKGIFLAISLSSLCFGLTHLTNLFVMPQLKVYTAAQVIYAFLIGFYFCTNYEKSGNILPCIIQHALFDFVAFFWEVYSTESYEASLVDIDLSTALYAIAFYIPLFLYALIILSGKLDVWLFGASAEKTKPDSADPEGFEF